MEYIINNWAIILALLVLLISVIAGIVAFFKLPTEKQIENMKKWLCYAVTKAEKELGEKTGAMKLHLVYDWAIERFPWVGSLITFDAFSKYVDEALEWMKEQLDTDGSAVSRYVKEV